MSSRSLVLSALCVLSLASSAAAGPLLDPAGDQFPAAGSGPDILRYSGENTGSAVTFSATFAAPISPASAGQPNSVLGYIDLDTDRNAATGGTAAFGYTPTGGASWINFGVDNGALAGPPVGLGAEFFVDLGSENLGLVSVFDAATNLPVGSVPITFTSDGFSLTIPLSLLGNPASPNFNYGIVAGDLFGSADRAPNGSVAAAVVPEPASLLAFGLAAAGAAGYGLRRRQRAVTAAAA